LAGDVPMPIVQSWLFDFAHKIGGSAILASVRPPWPQITDPNL